jgi:hypothetical protein
MSWRIESSDVVKKRESDVPSKKNKSHMIFWRKVTDKSFANLNISIRKRQAYKVAINLPRLTN